MEPITGIGQRLVRPGAEERARRDRDLIRTQKARAKEFRKRDEKERAAMEAKREALDYKARSH